MAKIRGSVAARRVGARSVAAPFAAALFSVALLATGAGMAASDDLSQLLRRQQQRPSSRPRSATPALGEPATPQPSQTELEAKARLRFQSPDVLDVPIDPETYILGPYDVLAIVILVGDVRSEQIPVLPEGVVVIPKVGTVRAAGRTLAQFRDALRLALSQRYRSFELYCYLAQPRQFRVYVTGEVQTPGVVAARAYERVSDLVERAGGLTVRASKREVELRNPDGKVRSRVDLAAFYSRGDLDSNPHLEAGQVIFVPVIGREVEIVGEVNAPGYYEARRGEALGELLQLAGGSSPLADLSQVSVESIDSTGAVSLRTLDLRGNSPPTDGVVRVAVLSSMLGKRRVFAIMPDGTQRTLYLAPQETLRDLVRRTAQVDPDADVAAATLATRDKDGRPEQVLVDLPRVLRGETDAPLQDGDVLSIPSVKSYVYMSGYVGKPGRLPYRADWTVNDYLGEGGGPATGGSRAHVKLIGTNGQERNGDRRTRVERGDTIYVDRSLGGKVATFLGVFTSISALVISVVAITRR